MKTTNNAAREKFQSAAVKYLTKAGLSDKTITRQQIIKVCDTAKLKYPNWLVNNLEYRTEERGVYSFSPGKTPSVTEKVKVKVPVQETPSPVVIEMSAGIKSIEGNGNSFVPSLTPGYVPFGHYVDINSIVKSKIFYPLFITGLSGNGKTMMVEEIHAKTKRELIRANITFETDEDDLIGGFRLIGGQTVWQDGPVVTAMKRGAGLLLDEIDLGSNKIMCLQPVLEGKAIYLKKTGQVVAPAPGFNIYATANTKGKGSDSGRFIGTNVLNEAFLERFALTFEQSYPPETTEKKILHNILESFGTPDDNFVQALVSWAQASRKSFEQDVLDELISTRRLVHICQAFKIFKDKLKSVELCVSRFDDDTKRALVEMYTKFDENVTSKANAGTDDSVPIVENIPF